MKTTLLLCLGSGLLVLSSCQHDPDPVITAPQVVVDKPVELDTYHVNDTLFLQGTLSDDDELHEASVLVRSSTDTMFAFDPFVHELPSYTVDTFWVVSGISASTPAFVTMTASNHHDKTTEMNIPVFLEP